MEVLNLFDVTSDDDICVPFQSHVDAAMLYFTGNCS